MADKYDRKVTLKKEVYDAIHVPDEDITERPIALRSDVRHKSSAPMMKVTHKGTRTSKMKSIIYDLMA